METKPWWQSVTILAALFGSLSAVFGDTIVGQILSDPQTAEHVATAVTGVSGLVAIWERVRATKGVTT